MNLNTPWSIQIQLSQSNIYVTVGTVGHDGLEAQELLVGGVLELGWILGAVDLLDFGRFA